MAQESGHLGSAGVVPDVGRSADPGYLARLHHSHPVGHRKGLVVVVGDVQDSDADASQQGSQLLGELVAAGTVEGAERLVEHQQAGLRRERAGQRDPLGLAARQRGDLALLEAGQPNQSQHLPDPLPPADGVRLLHPQPEGNVLGHVAVREQRVLLEHQPEVAAVHRQAHQVLAIPADLAGVQGLQAGHGPQQGALAAAAGPEDGHHLAGGNLQIDLIEGLDPPEGNRGAAHRQHLEPPSAGVAPQVHDEDCHSGERHEGHGLAAQGLAITHTWLRPDPLEVLGTIGSEAPRPASPVRVVRRIAAMPEARLALLAMVVGQTVMVTVMTATPLHMTSGDQDYAVIGRVISLHIIGMYAFSPIVGWLVDRLGTHTVITLGGLILFLGAELAGHTDPEHSAGLFSGVTLVGVGWSFGLIAGSALLTNSFPVRQRVEVQGGADFVMITGGAVGGLSSGALVELIGFQSLSHYSGIAGLLLVAAAAGAWITARLARPRQLA